MEPDPMAKARALDKRRKSIRNIRKITRTMELIATARFRKAMDRATAARAYTDRITQLVANLSRTGLEVSHPLLLAASADRIGDLARADGQPRTLWWVQRQCAAGGPRPLGRAESAHSQRPSGDLRQARHRRVSLPQDRAPRQLHALRGQDTLRGGRSARRPLPR